MRRRCASQYGSAVDTLARPARIGYAASRVDDVLYIRLHLQPWQSLGLVAQFEYGFITVELVLRCECADAAQRIANADRIDGKTEIVAGALEGALVDNAGGYLGADLAARRWRTVDTCKDSQTSFAIGFRKQHDVSNGIAAPLLACDAGAGARCRHDGEPVVGKELVRRCLVVVPASDLQRNRRPAAVLAIVNGPLCLGDREDTIAQSEQRARGIAQLRVAEDRLGHR